MVEGVRRQQWEQTSHILAWLENTSKGKNSRPTLAKQRNPFLSTAQTLKSAKLSDPAILAANCGILPAD